MSELKLRPTKKQEPPPASAVDFPQRLEPFPGRGCAARRKSCPAGPRAKSRSLASLRMTTKGEGKTPNHAGNKKAPLPVVRRGAQASKRGSDGRPRPDNRYYDYRVNSSRHRVPSHPQIDNCFPL